MMKRQNTSLCFRSHDDATLIDVVPWHWYCKTGGDREALGSQVSEDQGCRLTGRATAKGRRTGQSWGIIGCAPGVHVAAKASRSLNDRGCDEAIAFGGPVSSAR